MKLPDINELEEFNAPPKEKAAPKPKKQAAEKQDKIEQSNGKRKPRIPKSEYDENGNPILMIPDLNDSDLKNEINRFLGK